MGVARGRNRAESAQIPVPGCPRESENREGTQPRRTRRRPPGAARRRGMRESSRGFVRRFRTLALQSPLTADQPATARLRNAGIRPAPGRSARQILALHCAVAEAVRLFARRAADRIDDDDEDEDDSREALAEGDRRLATGVSPWNACPQTQEPPQGGDRSDRRRRRRRGRLEGEERPRRKPQAPRRRYRCANRLDSRRH